VHAGLCTVLLRALWSLAWSQAQRPEEASDAGYALSCWHQEAASLSQ